MAGQVRIEELLAKAVTIDGRKEWYCRFCSETNVWTRSKCRSCQTNIPSVLHGRHQQAVSTKAGRSGWRVRRQSVGAQSRLGKKQNYGSCAKKARGSRKKEGNRRRREKWKCMTKSIATTNWKDMLKRLQNIDECPDMPQAAKDVFKETWQQERQDIEQRRMISCRSIKRCRRGHKSCRAYKTDGSIA